MSSSTTGNASNNWRNPSAADMQKYGLRPLPDDFAPTEEEQGLLNMYEVIRNYERTAKKLKEEEARAKLAARDAEFQQAKISASAQKRKRRKEKKLQKTEDEMDDMEEDDDEIESDLDEDDEDDAHERTEAKLAELREEIEEKKRAVNNVNEEEDYLRQKHLETQDEVDDGPMLKKKRKDYDQPATSLIANLTAAVTPPHDFSEKLELKGRGKVLFPEAGSDEYKWSPPSDVYSPNEGAFLVELNDFDVERASAGIGNNTIAIKFMAPADAKRFSINIASPNHGDFDSVLFHFNPRQREKGGQLVINDKQEGIWGQAISIPLSRIPLMFGQTACTLMIQINGEGFDIFVEDKHCARLEHRTELPSGASDLVLQFPSTDDYGKPENWSVYKVWWGNRPIMAKGDVSDVPGVNSFNALHPRKIFVSGLPKIYSEAEVDLRRAELERAFRKYGGDRGVHTIIPTNTTYAFVEMETERMADLALQEMTDKYRMNRARRSKHEALQEERAAKEAAAGGGGKKETTAWD